MCRSGVMGSSYLEYRAAHNGGPAYRIDHFAAARAASSQRHTRPDAPRSMSSACASGPRPCLRRRPSAVLGRDVVDVDLGGLEQGLGSAGLASRKFVATPECRCCPPQSRGSCRRTRCSPCAIGQRGIGDRKPFDILAGDQLTRNPIGRPGVVKDRLAVFEACHRVAISALYSPWLWATVSRRPYSVRWCSITRSQPQPGTQPARSALPSPFGIKLGRYGRVFQIAKVRSRQRHSWPCRPDSLAAAPSMNGPTLASTSSPPDS